MATKPRHTGRDATLAMALARGMSIAAAARQAGFSERTAHRRLEDSEFRDRVQELRGGMVEQAVGLLSASNVSAVTTLSELLKDKSASIRLSAAKSILELSTKMRESMDLAPLVEKLQARVAELEKTAK